MLPTGLNEFSSFPHNLFFYGCLIDFVFCKVLKKKKKSNIFKSALPIRLWFLQPNKGHTARVAVLFAWPFCHWADHAVRLCSDDNPDTPPATCCYGQVGTRVRTEVTWSEVALQDCSPCLLQSSLALATHFILWGSHGSNLFSLWWFGGSNSSLLVRWRLASHRTLVEHYCPVPGNLRK